MVHCGGDIAALRGDCSYDFVFARNLLRVGASFSPMALMDLAGNVYDRNRQAMSVD